MEISKANDIKLLNKERFEKTTPISKEKLSKALDNALERVEKLADKLSDMFVGTCSVDYKYIPQNSFHWESGMLTGLYWLSYQLTGKEKFRKTAEKQIKIFGDAALNKTAYKDHDTGFIIVPSCVAGYKITGNEYAKKAAIAAADILLEHYCFENNFIIRSGTRKDAEENISRYRTLVDSMMNIPLLFWTYKETNDKKYLDAAVNHYKTTIKYLIRDDGSSFHHYQFDPFTGKPMYGVTLQGNADNSCWGRGHSWLLYGFPIAYSYTMNTEIPDIHKAVSYYMLNKLPSDYIPYWDFDFTEGSDAPRDSSVAAITVCGFLEMCKYLPENSEEKRIFKNAADAMMNSLIDNCENNTDADGLILHVTHALPQGEGIDQCAVYGDYFYLEALMRYLNPEWEMFW